MGLGVLTVGDGGFGVEAAKVGVGNGTGVSNGREVALGAIVEIILKGSNEVNAVGDSSGSGVAGTAGSNVVATGLTLFVVGSGVPPSCDGGTVVARVGVAGTGAGVPSAGKGALVGMGIEVAAEGGGVGDGAGVPEGSRISLGLIVFSTGPNEVDAVGDGSGPRVADTAGFNVVTTGLTLFAVGSGVSPPCEGGTVVTGVGEAGTGAGVPWGDEVVLMRMEVEVAAKGVEVETGAGVSRSLEVALVPIVELIPTGSNVVCVVGNGSGPGVIFAAGLTLVPVGSGVPPPCNGGSVVAVVGEAGTVAGVPSGGEVALMGMGVEVAVNGVGVGAGAGVSRSLEVALVPIVELIPTGSTVVCVVGNGSGPGVIFAAGLTLVPVGSGVPSPCNGGTVVAGVGEAGTGAGVPWGGEVVLMRMEVEVAAKGAGVEAGAGVSRSLEVALVPIVELIPTGSNVVCVVGNGSGPGVIFAAGLTLVPVGSGAPSPCNGGTVVAGIGEAGTVADVPSGGEVALMGIEVEVAVNGFGVGAWAGVSRSLEVALVPTVELIPTGSNVVCVVGNGSGPGVIFAAGLTLVPVGSGIPSSCNDGTVVAGVGEAGIVAGVPSGGDVVLMRMGVEVVVNGVGVGAGAGVSRSFEVALVPIVELIPAGSNAVCVVGNGSGPEVIFAAELTLVPVGSGVPSSCNGGTVVAGVGEAGTGAGVPWGGEVVLMRMEVEVAAKGAGVEAGAGVSRSLEVALVPIVELIPTGSNVACVVGNGSGPGVIFAAGLTLVPVGSGVPPSCNGGMVVAGVGEAGTVVGVPSGGEVVLMRMGVEVAVNGVRVGTGAGVSRSLEVALVPTVELIPTGSNVVCVVGNGSGKGVIFAAGLTLVPVGSGVPSSCNGGMVVAEVGEAGTVAGVPSGGEVALMGMGVEVAVNGVRVGAGAGVSRSLEVALVPTVELIPTGSNVICVVGNGSGPGVIFAAGLTLVPVGSGVPSPCNGGTVVTRVGEAGTVAGVASGGEVALMGMEVEVAVNGVGVGAAAGVSNGPGVALGPIVGLIITRSNEVDAVGDSSGPGVADTSGSIVVTTGSALVTAGLEVLPPCDGEGVVARMGKAGIGAGVRTGDEIALVGLRVVPDVDGEGVEVAADEVGVGVGAGIPGEDDLALGPIVEVIPAGSTVVDTVGDGSGTGVANPAGSDVVAMGLTLIAVGLGVTPSSNSGTVVVGVGEASREASVATGGEVALMGLGGVPAVYGGAEKFGAGVSKGFKIPIGSIGLPDNTDVKCKFVVGDGTGLGVVNPTGPKVASTDAIGGLDTDVVVPTGLFFSVGLGVPDGVEVSLMRLTLLVTG